MTNKRYRSNKEVVMSNAMALHSFNVIKDRVPSALMYYAISHIEVGATELTKVCMHWEDFTDFMPMTKSTCRDAIKRAVEVTVTFMDGDTKVTEPIFDTCEWRAGKVTLLVNQRLAPHLINLTKDFTVVPLRVLSRLSGSGHNQRALFWYLASQDNRLRKRVGISLENMIDICRLPASRRKIYNVRKVISDLNALMVSVTDIAYHEHYDVLTWEVSFALTTQVDSPAICKVAGVGYTGDGVYSRTATPRQYGVWASMLYRCYSPEGPPAYHGVSVCSEWYDLQTFGKWFDANYIEGYSLDKDLMSEEVKIYSPSTCLFIPKGLNSFLARNPIGVVTDTARARMEAKNQDTITSWKEKMQGILPSEAISRIR